MRSAFSGWLGEPWAPLASIAIALLLASPALVTGLAGDDHFQKLVLTGNREIAAVSDDPLAMFVWASGDRAQALAMMEVGMTGWWTNPDLVMAYFRPLATATHWLDYRLWPDAPWLMHLHSLAWFALALLLLAQLYRRLLAGVAPAWLPALALLLYAIDDAHAMTLAWVANRNAIVACTFAIAALLLHDRHARDGERRAAIAAPLVLGLALLASESALALAGYLIAYSLFIDPAPRPRALRRLLPHAAVIGLWAVLYRAAGYGARGSGLVVDPGSEPLRYLGAALERVPVLLAGQFAIPPSDGWEAYPMIGAWLRPAVHAWILLIVALFALALRAKLRALPSARFFGLGMTLAALPVAAQFPHDRLLMLIGVGAAPLVALLIGDVLQSSERTPPARLGLQRGVGYACIGLHLVLAPLLLPVRVLAPLQGERLVSQGDRSLDQSAAVRDKTLVLMNPPLDAFAGFLPTARAAQGRPRPRGLRWLATGASDLTVTRLDAHSLRVRPAGGFLALPSERMQRNPDDRMPVGYRVRYSDLTIEVSAVTADARPAEIVARFDRPLEDPHYQFYAWRDERYERFALPAVGARRVLPRFDFTKLVY